MGARRRARKHLFTTAAQRHRELRLGTLESVICNSQYTHSMKTTLLLSAIIPVVLSLAFGQEKRAPLILSVERATHGTIYRLNSKNVTTAPLHVLAEAIRSRGQDIR